MSNKYFALWRDEHIVFPKTVTINEEVIEVNSNFKIALKILKLQSDTEIAEIRKPKLMLSWFYAEPQKIRNPKTALDTMSDFLVHKKMTVNDPMRGISTNDKADKGVEKQSKVCFEFDAEEIYVSFIQDYKIDLMTVEYLHWYKFLMLFSNLSKECAFTRKYELRTLDLKDFKGKDKAKLEKAKKDVQIPVKLTATELSMMEELAKKLNMYDG